MQLNSSVTVYSPSQNISNPSTEKQLRKQIYNIPKSANNNLQEHQPEETNPRSSKRSSNSNIALRWSQWERRPLKYFEDYKTWFDEYRNDIKMGPKGRVVS